MADSRQSSAGAQTAVVIGVDVGGTFTDLVASDGREVRVVKVPSTPGAFEEGVIEAIRRAGCGREAGEVRPLRIVHGSTVATNALLQRAGERVAFITTDGFADMLLIGRQNRPRLYALQVERPRPIADDAFGVRERIDARGHVVEALDEGQVEGVIRDIVARGIRHAAVCLLFAFVNPVHERRVGEMCRSAGLTVSLSCELLPEFREYERASTTTVNAALRPVVETYLNALKHGLRTAEAGSTNDTSDPPSDSSLILPSSSFSVPLSIMHSSGGTLTPKTAAEQAVRMVLSGPAGGVLGAAYVAKLAGYDDVITYDMGGTSTDVATILGGSPQWTTSSIVDGLPVAIPMFDIHTVGAGGGSVAYVDAGGALRVGPRSAGARPGPACYARGGAEPTVTDANVLLRRIPPDGLLGDAITLRRDLAQEAIAKLARDLRKSPVETALGIVTVVQANMEKAIRVVTSRRGHDPRQFTLVSFGGAGGLHACAIAANLGIPRVLVPPCAGVLSALGMVVAPPVAEASKTVLHLGEELDDARLAAEYGFVSGRTMDVIPYDQSASVEAWADVRFRGQSHELKVRVGRPSREEIEAQFRRAYEAAYGRAPTGRAVEIVTVRVRRIGRGADLRLPSVREAANALSSAAEMLIVDEEGQERKSKVLTRRRLLEEGPVTGPALLIDAEATAYVPADWRADACEDGAVILTRGGGDR